MSNDTLVPEWFTDEFHKAVAMQLLTSEVVNERRDRQRKIYELLNQKL